MRFLLTATLLLTMNASLVAQPNPETASPSLPSGPSFRVETELFEGDNLKPSARHLILFDSGVIYDMRVDDTRYATLYDPTRGRVVLLDRSKGVHTILSTTDLLQATAQLRAAIEQEGKGTQFGLSAAVVMPPVASKDVSQTYEIGFGDCRYRTTTQSVTNAEIPQAYLRFANLAAQLNVLRRRGVPPFARMTLGQHIADAGLLPLETMLEVRNGLRKEKYRSHLLVVEQLSVNDRNRINEWGRELAATKQVPLNEFE
jgi:hypothetical protein